MCFINPNITIQKLAVSKDLHTLAIELCCLLLLDDSALQLSGQLALTNSNEPQAYSHIAAFASVTTSTVNLAASVA